MQYGVGSRAECVVYVVGYIPGMGLAHLVLHVHSCGYTVTAHGNCSSLQFCRVECCEVRG